MKKLLISLLLLKCTMVVHAQPNQLAQSFASPPDSIRPYVYWYWINDHVSPQGVIKDLEAMKKVGIGGAFIGNIGLSESDKTSYGNIKIFSPVWWKAVETAMETAGKLDINMGMFNSPGWSQSGGPWVNPESSMRYIATEMNHVKGGQSFSKQMNKFGTDSAYLFSIAFPASQHAQFDIQNYSPKLRSKPESKEIEKLFDGLTNQDVVVNSEYATASIDIILSKPVMMRSLILYPSIIPFAAKISIQTIQNNKVEDIHISHFDRTNNNIETGFNPKAPIAISFPEKTGQHFRIHFSDVKGKLAFSEIALTPNEVLDHYSEKQLAKMYPTPLPLWDAYRWDNQTEPKGIKDIIDPSKISKLDAFVDKDGILKWKAPKGNWTLFHLYAVPTGVKNSPASKEGKGLEIDKLDANKLPLHFDAFIGEVLKNIPKEKRKTFKYIVADSYEMGSQNWTDHFQKKFKEIYKYDPIPYLPVLSGLIVGNADQSNRFLWDLRRFVADLVAYEYVGGLRKLGNQHGLKLWLENYGHWGFPSEFLKYGGQSDEVAGEFWNEGDLGNIENKSASSAAHIYGKKRVWAESFTAGGGEYGRYPALLKQRGDWVFTQGVNQTLLHLYIHQPEEQYGPGINTWFSTEFNRKNTWFEASKDYIDYLRRCNFMLQQGNSVNEVAYFIGEDAPIMTGTRQPELPKGYDYDYVNAEVIYKMSVKDQKLQLPGGASYRIMVLPPSKQMRPALIEKIAQLVKDGAVILGSPPTQSPSLEGYPLADDKVRQLANDLWNGRIIQDGIRQVGKGYVMENIDLQSALNFIHLTPDFEAHTSNEIAYTHRATQDKDIYFVSNQSNEKTSFEATFRVTSGVPYWFDPVSGEMKNLAIVDRTSKGTKISFLLAVAESGFVVFDHKSPNTIVHSPNNFVEPKKYKEITAAWTVTFKGLLEQGHRDSTVTFDKLISWIDHEDNKIKNFSGTAVYMNNFDLDYFSNDQKYYIQTLPIVGIGRVKINGEHVGTLWTAPWRIEISKFLKSGKNSIEIEVSSTWKNRLIAEKKLPADQRKLKVEINNYNENSPYDPSGLVGSVTISNN